MYTELWSVLLTLTHMSVQYKQISDARQKFGSHKKSCNCSLT